MNKILPNIRVANNFSTSEETSELQKPVKQSGSNRRVNTGNTAKLVSPDLFRRGDGSEMRRPAVLQGRLLCDTLRCLQVSLHSAVLGGGVPQVMEK